MRLSFVLKYIQVFVEGTSLILNFEKYTRFIPQFPRAVTIDKGNKSVTVVSGITS